MPTIVQFLHPGGEALPINETTSIIPWNNTANHKRKFLVSKGKYVDSVDSLVEDDLCFWGEWEAQSKVKKINKSDNNPPQYFQFPFLNASVAKRKHTTDPYVFGKSFRYIICMQKKFKHVLVDMTPGSIILFGSSIKKKFCVDTVFVVSNVKSNYTHDTINNLECFGINDVYKQVTLNPIYGNRHFNNGTLQDTCRLDPASPYTFYEGVKFSDRDLYNGLYSFVPCKIYNEKKSTQSAFVQPAISLDFFTGLQTQGVTSKECSDLEIKVYWNKIVAQIEAASLLKCVALDNPPLG